MKIKLPLTNLIKICALFFLVAYIFPCPIYAVAEEPHTGNQIKPREQGSGKKPDPANNPTDNQASTTNQPNTQNATADSFFKDATYEKFEPQEDSKAFAAGYLEITP